jgi:hypothetical protein
MTKVVYFGKYGDVHERKEAIKYQLMDHNKAHVSYFVDLEKAKKAADTEQKTPPKSPPKKAPTISSIEVKN